MGWRFKWEFQLAKDLDGLPRKREQTEGKQSKLEDLNSGAFQHLEAGK